MNLSHLEHIVDLTHEIDESTPVYPGDPMPFRENIYTVSKDGFAVDAWYIGTHTGTHVDAVAHVFCGVSDLADYPLTQFEGVARVIDATEGTISLEDVCKVCKSDRKIDWLIIRSGWSRHWETPEKYFQGLYPILNLDAVDFLINTGIKGIAMDMPSPDPYGTDNYIHKKILSAGLLIAENLTNLEKLPVNKDIWLSVWPLKLISKDAAPARVIARF